MKSKSTDCSPRRITASGWRRSGSDVARYGDTNGYLHDILRTGWPWRDWVIRAFNQDMPFDRFVVEQVAGDLLPGGDTRASAGDGFLPEPSRSPRRGARSPPSISTNMPPTACRPLEPRFWD